MNMLKERAGAEKISASRSAFGYRLRSGSSGFTLLEALIAMVVLSFGILGLAAMMTDGIAYMNMSQDDFIAQQKAEEAVESIFYARDSQLYTWAQLQNVSNGGVFVDGFNPLDQPGPSGIIDNGDNYTNPIPDVIYLPDANGILGVADDPTLPLTNFTRQVVITDVPGINNLRQIVVTVKYISGKFQRQYVLTSYMSAFS